MVADVRQPPFAGQSFDLVVSPSTLDHFEDPSDLGLAIGGIREMLTTQGRLIITLDNRQNIFDPFLRLVIRLGVIPYFVGRSYRIGLLDELEAEGLEDTATTASARSRDHSDSLRSRRLRAAGPSLSPGSSRRSCANKASTVLPRSGDSRHSCTIVLRPALA